MAMVRIALKIYWAQAAVGFAVGFIVPWLQFIGLIELRSTQKTLQITGAADVIRSWCRANSMVVPLADTGDERDNSSNQDCQHHNLPA